MQGLLYFWYEGLGNVKKKQQQTTKLNTELIKESGKLTTSQIQGRAETQLLACSELDILSITV